MRAGEKKTPPAAAPKRRPSAELVEAYEALRRCVLAGKSSAQGLAIVLEHGVAAWAEVCSAVLAGARAEPTGPRLSRRPPEQLSRELVDLMTQMVFSNRTELQL